MKTKAEKREIKKQKTKKQTEQSGTLSGQILRTKTLKNYSGSKKSF